MSDQLDVTRAVGVLNAAMKHGMLPEGSIPESDSDKIIEAEKMIELARQAKTVADQIGKGNVPNYEGIIGVLSEAEVFLGIGSAEHEAATATQQIAPTTATPEQAEALTQQVEQAAAPPQINHIDVIDTPAENKRVYVHEGCDGGRTAYMVPMDDVPPPAIGSMTECANCSYQVPIASHRVEQPQPPAPPPTPVAEPQPVPAVQPPGLDDDPTDAQPGEMWLDQHGTPVEIVTYAGGPQVEIKFVTGETTVVPIGFIKQRAQTTGQEPTPSSISQPAPPPPLPPQPPPSTPPIEPPAAMPSEASSSLPSADGGQASPEPLPPAPSEQPSTSSPPEVPAPPRQDTGPVDDDGGDPEYRRMLDETEANYSPNGFPTPMDLERPPEEMPDDLTAIGDLVARRLHSQFNALAARARFLHGLEAAKARGCERIRRLRLQEPLARARAELGKGSTLTEAKLLAEQDESVVIWIQREEIHKERADAYRTFLSLYSENVTVLSRDWTMRAAEEQGS